jgi:arylsulfatase
MSKKNILLIFTDQQRFDTIAALGNPIIKTPALDALVADGVAFSRAYTPCPVCIPARYSMHTGQMPHRVDCVVNEPTPSDRISFMQVLNRHGYQTHGVGKMHFAMRGMTPDALWGFESRDTSEEGGTGNHFKSYLEENGYDYVHDPQGVRGDMYYIPQPSQLPARLHNTTWVVDRSIDFLKRRDPDRPFMLMTSFIKPHPPFESPTPWNKLYRGPEMPLPKCPEGSDGLITYWNRFQNRYKYKDQGVDNHLIRQIKAAYYSSISFVDYHIGRLVAYLKEQDLYKDTLIVFTADHGEMLGDYHCVGKRNFLDSAARIPMIMVHPEMDGGAICYTPTSLVDIFPTFLGYAGIEPWEDLCGIDLCSIVRGESERDIVFGQYQRGEYAMYMAVTKRYKYIYSAPDQKEWLFDLKTDPEETRNKAYNPMFLHTRDSMRNRLIDSLKADGYTMPFEGDRWKEGEKKTFNDDPDSLLLFQDPQGSIPRIPGYEREELLYPKGPGEGPYRQGF